MTLAVGQALSAYEVLGFLGDGGMGGVYRAWDTRLGREVALEVLPETFATDEERLCRGASRAVIAAPHADAGGGDRTTWLRSVGARACAGILEGGPEHRETGLDRKIDIGR